MRVGSTYKDRGHHARKVAGYSLLGLAFLPYSICYGLGRVAEWFDHRVTPRLHRWMRPCLYARKP